MAKSKIKLTKNIVAEILLSKTVQDAVDDIGRDMAGEAGEGYIYKPGNRYEKRDRGIVVPNTGRAYGDHIHNNTLPKVLVSYKLGG